MTTNRERVARIISDALSPALLPAGALGLGEGLADALNDAGLLAPDLPGPDTILKSGYIYVDSPAPAWSVDGYARVAVTPNGQAWVYDDGRYVEETPDDLENIALALLAAARHARKEPPQC